MDAQTTDKNDDQLIGQTKSKQVIKPRHAMTPRYSTKGQKWLQSVCATRQTPRSFQCEGGCSVFIIILKIRYLSFRFGYL